MFMDTMYQYQTWTLVVMMLIAIWEMIWKGMALWHCAKASQKPWFVCILIFNTLGLLPIIYLLWFRPKKNHSGENIVRVESASQKKVVKRKKK